MTKLLVTGDLHLGRTSARVPADADPEVASTTAAWHRIVQAAIDHGVDLLCLTGDIADQSNRFWEAIGQLERGLARLGEHRIQTLAVAGNHDHEVLPRLADNLDPTVFRLLGRGGTWERYAVERDGATALAIDGWSFPNSHVRESPIEAYRSDRVTGVPQLVMVHGDLNAPASTYAPLDQARMQALPVDGWLLGHVHAPFEQRDADGPLVLYPGSPQALDPGETGAHGPWLVELGPAGIESVEQLPLSGVRYEWHAIDLTDVEDEAAFDATVLAGLEERGRALVDTSSEALRFLSLRLQLTGRTPLAPQLRQLAANIREIDRSIEQVRVGVERVEVQATPPLDLAEHARSHTPPGALARLLLALDEAEPPDEVRALIAQTRRQLEQVRSRRDFLPLQAPTEVDETTARTYLHREAQQLLTELLGQNA